MISFAKLLLLSKDEWEKVREKSKPPKPKLDGALYDVLISTLENRLAQYPTALEVLFFLSLCFEGLRDLVAGR